MAAAAAASSCRTALTTAGSNRMSTGGASLGETQGGRPIQRGFWIYIEYISGHSECCEILILGVFDTHEIFNYFDHINLGHCLDAK